MVKYNLTTHVKHIAYHAHDAPTSHSGDVGAEPLAGPHDRVVRQGIQLGPHLLRLKALLVAFGHPQALLITFDGGFHPTTPLVVEVNIGQQDGGRVLHAVDRLLGEPDNLRRRQGRNQYAHAPLAVLLPAAYRDPPDRTARGGVDHSHPADLALRDTRVLHPCRDARRQSLGPRARIILAMHVIPTAEQPVHIIHAPSARIHAPERPVAFVVIQVQ